MKEIQKTLKHLAILNGIIFLGIFFNIEVIPFIFPVCHLSTFYFLTLSILLIFYYDRMVVSRKGHRTLMLGIARMIMLLILLRGIKYIVVIEQDILARYTWYLYYIPILMIPTFLYYLSHLIFEKDDTFLFGKRLGYLLISLLLILLVLTNDLHQQVFQFHPGFAHWDDDYSCFGFYVIIFSGWSFLLCFMGIVETVRAIQCGKKWNVFGAFLLTVGSFLLVQIGYDYYMGQRIGSMSILTRSFSDASAGLWIFLLAALTALMTVIHVLNRKYLKENVTPATIKQCADNMPCGICYWNDRGHVIFSNKVMDQLCIEITGTPLLNGLSLRQAVKNGIMTVGERVWKISTKETYYRGGLLHEMMAVDISEIYQKTAQLHKDNQDLASLTRELQQFSINIDEAVRREEILRAKVNIHDEMNRLLLTTDAADPGNREEYDRIFSMWERNALLLCQEADTNSSENSMKHLELFAQALGIELIWETSFPDQFNEKFRELFFAAAREAMANAVKHAHARQMRIRIEDSDTQILFRFINEGGVHSGDVRFNGGLVNLSHMADSMNFQVEAHAQENCFILSLCCIK